MTADAKLLQNYQKLEYEVILDPPSCIGFFNI